MTIINACIIGLVAEFCMLSTPKREHQLCYDSVIECMCNKNRRKCENKINFNLLDGCTDYWTSERDVDLDYGRCEK